MVWQDVVIMASFNFGQVYELAFTDNSQAIFCRQCDLCDIGGRAWVLIAWV